MKKTFGVVLLLIIGIVSGYGQRISRVASGVDVGASFAKGQFAPSLLYYQALHPANSPWIEINGGARVWSYFANDTYLTAPAGNSKEDAMQLSRVTATGISFVMGANFKLAKVIDLGVNADLLGISFGKRRNAIYRLASPESVKDSLSLELNGEDVGIAPANLNVIPFLKNKNNGQAEAFIRVWVSPQLAIKAGYVWGQVSYRADMKLNNGQKRFSTNYQMPYVAITIPLYN
ncbi:hypothetical protein [Salmonirosea aquatica]|uniref:Uncharacterized protein n=1 Tax=Salmonirosea aquatica TaxID=2654236 RepID=A0A7C9B8Q9_9BACT|nr:hypothetical protein [Cytophagaceae bacterium SJW1-29]